ncbi:hypothetical protein NDU88_011468 [Pleurodeles waltl]|uniref:Uncharacterized protein n=1 Tax=Pleurodeles waltl TaxID=8319 RepID=A0AAV7PYI6_PLEWA|nr:hypothetical protein NDU88_011468 [Pleurodeles waltl]
MAHPAGERINFSLQPGQWAHLTLRLLWRVARAVLKEYPGDLNDPLAPSDSCGVAAQQSKNNVPVYWGTRLDSPTPVGV